MTGGGDVPDRALAPVSVVVAILLASVVRLCFVLLRGIVGGAAGYCALAWKYVFCNARDEGTEENMAPSKLRLFIGDY